jgi:hypothetical protein
MDRRKKTGFIILQQIKPKVIPTPSYVVPTKPLPLTAQIINLAHRSDRWSAVSSEFARLGISFNRIDAVHTPENGALGCLASHIKALEICAAENKHAWICEDDIIFTASSDELNYMISEFLTNSCDVLCLGYNSIGHIEYNETFYRTRDTQTASCYLVKCEFIPVLLELWKSVYASIMDHTKHALCEKFMELNVRCYDFYAADQCWKLLQASHVFLISKKRAVVQRPSYSDIEKRNVDYKC